MSFKYDTKETYTQAELNTLLGQHKEYLAKDSITKVEYEELNKKLEVAEKELAPFKAGARDSHVLGLLKGVTSDSKLKAAVKMSDINSDTSDEDIVKNVKKTVKDNDFLQSTEGIIDGEGVKTKIIPPKVDSEESDKNPKTYKFTHPLK